MRINVFQAGAHHTDVVIEILAEASSWLQSRGITQWPRQFPTELIASAIAEGSVYLMTSGTEIAATITLQWSDRPFWGERRDAGFVHRLAVRRAYAGLGTTLIAWADEQTARRNRNYLCLDCLSGNDRLRRYYEDLGFQLVKEIDGPHDHPHGAAHGPWRAALYERPVTRSHAVRDRS